MKTKYQKDLERLQIKGTDHCTLCGAPFDDDDDITYTVFGYTKLGKLQVTSGCCIDRIVDVRLIGLYGDIDLSDYNDYLREHPLYDTFMKNKAPIDLALLQQAMGESESGSGHDE